jgi:hypothetical protein
MVLQRLLAGCAFTLVIAFALRTSLFGAGPATTQKPSTLREVTYCELVANAKQFDRVRVRITAFTEHAFEHFVLADPSCEDKLGFSFWVAFGGDVPSGAIYCCPGEGFPGGAPKPSAKAEFPLVDDKVYRRFRTVLDSEGDTTVRFTVVGTVLLKPDPEPGNPLSLMRGYGHMGCCNLFVIEQIERFDEHKRKDLNYKATGAFYDGRRCWRSLDDREDDWSEAQAIREQQTADAGDRRWAFSDPRRVALEALRRQHGAQVSDLVLVKTGPGLQVFEWRHDRRWTTAVVLRPYWLSSFAKTKDVVWTAAKLETTSCGVEIRPEGDVRAQVMEAFGDAFEPVVDARLPADIFSGGKVKGRDGPATAAFFEVINSYAVAVATDDRGWPSWVDIRPKSSYPIPIDVWPPFIVALDINVPLDRDSYDQFVAFIDAVRPFGAPIGSVKKSGKLRTQNFEHASLTWEDGSRDKNGSVGAVRAFSVRWNAKNR